MSHTAAVSLTSAALSHTSHEPTTWYECHAEAAHSAHTDTYPATSPQMAAQMYALSHLGRGLHLVYVGVAGSGRAQAEWVDVG